MKKIAIAWREDKDDLFSLIVLDTIKYLGFEPYFLEQVKADFIDYNGTRLKKEYLDLSSNKEEQFCMLNLETAEKLKALDFSSTNVYEVLNGVSAVVFTGGEDISSTLFFKPEKAKNNGENFCAEKDVSDYILMKYCLEHNIKVFAICRGMQMMAIVSGSKIVQDLDEFYKAKNIEYDFTHRTKARNEFSSHGISFKKETLIYNLFDNLKDGFIDNIPSWHHQAVLSCPKNVTVSGVHNTLGERIIEAIEIENNPFAIGVQFHIEELIYEKINKRTVNKKLEKTAEVFMKKVLSNLTK